MDTHDTDWIAFSIISGLEELMCLPQDIVILEGTAARVFLDVMQEPYDPDGDPKLIGRLVTPSAPISDAVIGYALGRSWRWLPVTEVSK